MAHNDLSTDCVNTTYEYPCARGKHPRPRGKIFGDMFGPVIVDNRLVCECETPHGAQCSTTDS
jgi:hypothetical protein